MEKQILILGNGLDIDCKLPTRYADFYLFTQALGEMASADNVEAAKKILKDEYLFGSHYQEEEFKDLLKNDVEAFIDDVSVNAEHPKERKYTNPLTVLYDLTRDNYWIKNVKTDNKDYRWINFEDDISRVVQEIDGLRDYPDPFGQPAKFLLSDYVRLLSEVPSYRRQKDELKEITGNSFRFPEIEKRNSLTYSYDKTLKYLDVKNRLYYDLQELTLAFELYLSCYVSRLDLYVSETFRKLFEKLCATNTTCKIITFNYTDTLERMADVLGNRKGIELSYDICHVHGCCRSYEKMTEDLKKAYPFGVMGVEFIMKSLLKGCHIVLGIGEYNAIDNHSSEFADVKNFYQRIIQSIDDPDVESWKYQDWENLQPDDKCKLYIYGHSLGTSDKDILSEFIGKEAVKTYCYHESPEARKGQMDHLIAMLGTQAVIQDTKGRPEDRKIVFRPQDTSHYAWRIDTDGNVNLAVEIVAIPVNDGE